MREPINHYAVLGVPPTASADQIRKAKQQLAMRYHPDRNRNPIAHEMMAEVNRAAAVLLDPAQRALYDAQLASERASTPPAPARPAQAPAKPPQRTPTHRASPRADRTANAYPSPSPRARPAPAPAAPTMLGRVLRAGIMSIVTAIAWAIGIALGVAGLMLAGKAQTLGLKIVLFVPLAGLGLVLPSMVMAGARRMLYGAAGHPEQRS